MSSGKFTKQNYETIAEKFKRNKIIKKQAQVAFKMPEKRVYKKTVKVVSKKTVKMVPKKPVKIVRKNPANANVYNHSEWDMKQFYNFNIPTDKFNSNATIREQIKKHKINVRKNEDGNTITMLVAARKIGTLVKSDLIKHCSSIDSRILKIYIKDIPPRITLTELKKEFAQYGEILKFEKVKIDGIESTQREVWITDINNNIRGNFQTGKRNTLKTSNGEFEYSISGIFEPKRRNVSGRSFGTFYSDKSPMYEIGPERWNVSGRPFGTFFSGKSPPYEIGPERRNVSRRPFDVFYSDKLPMYEILKNLNNF